MLACMFSLYLFFKSKVSGYILCVLNTLSDFVILLVIKIMLDIMKTMLDILLPVLSRYGAESV